MLFLLVGGLLFVGHGLYLNNFCLPACFIVAFGLILF